jgi:transcriptional regulator with XRE-family HTH domain
MARKATKRANSIDQHVALRLRAKREELGLSQTEVADAVGITFQQVQKYENGKNRIAAGRLWLIAKVFKVPVGYFFEGLR